MRFNETEYTTPGQMDFVPRERRNQIWNIVAAFSVTIILLIGLSFVPPKVGGHSVSSFVSIIMVGLLCFYVIYRKQQNLDLVMATEYQNMLFAQAVALGSSFCLFVRRDGTIVYTTDGINDVFPQLRQGNASALETLFEQGGVPKPDRERVMSAIYSTSSDRLVFPIIDASGESKEYVLTVEPLARPGGFALIRGREYRGQRAGVQLMPDVLRTTSADKLDHLLASSPIGLYVTDQFGRLEYVNPALERLLGYGGSELLESRVAIHHLLYQLNGQPVPDDYLIADFNGEALLQKKQGSLLNILLRQSLVRDAGGKVLGATGTILPHSGNTPS